MEFLYLNFSKHFSIFKINSYVTVYKSLHNIKAKFTFNINLIKKSYKQEVLNQAYCLWELERKCLYEFITNILLNYVNFFFIPYSISYTHHTQTICMHERKQIYMIKKKKFNHMYVYFIK